MSADLLQALERHARQRPQAPALHWFGARGELRELRWRELHGAALGLAAGLRGWEGEPLLVLLPNGAPLAVALLAGLWAGAQLVPAPPELPAPALAELVRRSGARAAIGPRERLERLAGLELRVPAEGLLESAAAGRGEPPPSARGVLLLRTSATTGEPRIVRRSGAALHAAGEACARRLELSPADRVLIAIPMAHAYGLEQALFAPLWAGAAVELHARFDPLRAREALARRPLSVLPAVPVIIDALARLGPGRAPALRRAYSAGSALPRRVAQAFARSYGVGVGQIYGASEFGGITFNDPDDPEFDPECAGAPLPGVALRIEACDASAGAPPALAPLGAQGQIAVSGPTLLDGYLGEAEPAAAGGFARSGDLGRLDARGRLFVTGRLKLLIDVGAHKVNPAEVEAVLMRHPQVREALVLPLAYTDTASRLRALVIPEAGAAPSRAALLAFARSQLLPYQVPRSLEFHSELPRTSGGKLLRRAPGVPERA